MDARPGGTLMKPARASLLLLAALLAPGTDGRAQAPPPKPARVDGHGDPLPRGALLRLGTARCRHAGRVMFVGFASGGRILVSAGEDRRLRGADAATGREVWVRPLADPDLISVGLSGDG